MPPEFAYPQANDFPFAHAECTDIWIPSSLTKSDPLLLV
jgi:hypothetical protein